MKSILVMIYTMAGIPGPLAMGYVPSFEDCKPAFHYVRTELYKPENIKKEIDLQFMFCMELDEQESSSEEESIKAVNKFYGTLSK